MPRLPHAGHPSHSYLFLVHPYSTGGGGPGFPKREGGEVGRERAHARVSQTALTPAAVAEAIGLRPSSSASVLDQ